MLLLSIISITCLLDGSQARYFKRDDGVTISSYQLVPERAPSNINVTDVVLPLTKVTSSGSSRRGLSLSTLVTIPTGSATVLTSGGNDEFYTSVTWGTETFQMIVDTGSSDTWVVENGFKCVSTTMSVTEAESSCDFGPYYTRSSTFVALPGLNFSTTYGYGSVSGKTHYIINFVTSSPHNLIAHKLFTLLIISVAGIMGTEEITRKSEDLFPSSSVEMFQKEKCSQCSRLDSLQ
jgi:hypothetical protein